MIRKVLDFGHVCADDTSRPLQNHDPARRKRFEARDLCDAERLRARQRRAVPLLARLKAWLANAVPSTLPKDSLGEAANYALKNRTALTRSPEAGHLDASNNYFERRLRAVAVGRKANPVRGVRGRRSCRGDRPFAGRVR